MTLPAPRTALLRRRDFALLFGAETVSMFGSRLVMVAMPFAVLAVPGAGLGDVGLVLAAKSLTLGLLVLAGGVWADRLPRQLQILGSDVVRCLAQAVAAVLLLTGEATVAALVLTNAVFGVGEAFARPALLGLVAQVVEPGEEQPANALMSLTDNLALVLGPAAAGVLVAFAGPGAALAVDAGTFAVSAAAMSLLRPRRTVEAGPPEPFLQALASGWREVRSRTWLWSTLVVFCLYSALVLPALFVLGPAFAASDRGGPADWGVICAGFGAGAVVGSLVALRWRPRRPGSVMVGALAVGATQAAVVVAPVPTWVVAVLEGVTGVAVAITFALWDTAVQERVPATAHARVSSFDYFSSLVLMPVGYAVVGPVAERAGTATTALVCSAVALVAAALVAGSRDVRGLRQVRVPAPASDPLTSPLPG